LISFSAQRINSIFLSFPNCIKLLSHKNICKIKNNNHDTWRTNRERANTEVNISSITLQTGRDHLGYKANRKINTYKRNKLKTLTEIYLVIEIYPSISINIYRGSIKLRLCNIHMFLSSDSLSIDSCSRNGSLLKHKQHVTLNYPLKL